MFGRIQPLLQTICPTKTIVIEVVAKRMRHLADIAVLLSVPIANDRDIGTWLIVCALRVLMLLVVQSFRQEGMQCCLVNLYLVF